MKLSKDQQTDWPKHLLELVHAYNSMRLAITRYSPHYVMLRYQPYLPIDLYFPMIRGTEIDWGVDYYIAKLCEWLWEAFMEVQVQSTSEAEKQKQYYERKANVISLETGKLALAKAEAYKGKRKVKDQWEEELYQVEHQVTDGIPSYLVKNQWTGCSWVLHQNLLFLITPARGTPLCMVVWAEWEWCATTMTLEEPTPGRTETEEVPESVKCLLPAQQQTAETLLGWVNRQLCAILWMFSGASHWIKDKKFDVEGPGVHESQCQHSGGRGIDHTDDACRKWLAMIKLNPTSLCARDCKLITLGAWNGSSSPHINFWGDCFILNTDGMRTPGIPMQGTQYHCYPIK